jgi:hypothetical protein
MGKVLSAADILAAQDRKRELVEVPEWGGSVYVQEISAADAERIAEEKIGMVEFCAMCMVDKDGKPLFTEDQVADLSEKSTGAFRKVMSAVTQLNGFVAPEEEEGKS